MKLYSSFDFIQPLGIEKNAQPAKSNRGLLVCNLPLPELDGFRHLCKMFREEKY